MVKGWKTQRQINDFLTVLPVYHLALKTIATLKGIAGPFFD
jgi:hypothetical protein